ncbi:hypothetical protein GSI_05080 [Ganoderma sinense ZZ0214-1]|uniref:Uncharacterized protein n=1 Tax=Ganoderma sinense ZZ0214-1 TaxID=1077348 RepID=A0A2G8SGT3_9APHY|nr:hypothetical protein GSI_05080 [Ganoderma sinense ZZ0214-1]
MGLHHSKERYTRIAVRCLGLLDSWLAHIPFMNLSDIKGDVATLRLLRKFFRNSTLRCISVAPEVHQRTLHDPESILPHVMAAAKLPPLPLTIPVLKLPESRFHDLISPPKHSRLSHTNSRSLGTHTHLLGLIPAPAEEHVFLPATHPRHASAVSAATSTRHAAAHLQPRRQAHASTEIGALTSNFVLDRPTCPNTVQGWVPEAAV